MDYYQEQIQEMQIENPPVKNLHFKLGDLLRLDRAFYQGVILRP